MPNAITDIEPSPTTINSGDATTLTIKYIATLAPLGKVEFRASAPFEISPAATGDLPLDPSGVIPHRLTIRRVGPGSGPARCDIVATYLTTSLTFFVRVT